MFAHMPGDGSGVDVETAARREADDDADSLALEKRFLCNRR
jgi:hypothetical protein